jgi:hypothetical protein
MGTTYAERRVLGGLVLVVPSLRLDRVFEAKASPMARRSFTVIDVTEILVHWYAGRSRSEVAVSLGLDRTTVRKYLAPARAAGIMPDGPPVPTAVWAGRVREWFPELVDTRLRQVSWPAR